MLELGSDRIKSCSVFVYIDDVIHGDLIEKVLNVPMEGDEYELYAKEQSYLGQYDNSGRMAVIDGKSDSSDKTLKAIVFLFIEKNNAVNYSNFITVINDCTLRSTF